MASIALVLVTGSSAGAYRGSQDHSAARPLHPAITPSVASTCTNPQQTSTVQGNPHVSSVPTIESVDLVARQGGLLISYQFRTPVALAPEGVYISWTIYLYRHRGDAARPTNAIELEVEDRGKGWEPTGWTIAASTYSSDSAVDGAVHTDAAHDEISAYFPPGFANLAPTFYWFASQEEYRAYLPRANAASPQNWSVNGSVVTDCPAGVRHDPDSLPYGTKLLMDAG